MLRQRSLRRKRRKLTKMRKKIRKGGCRKGSGRTLWIELTNSSSPSFRGKRWVQHTRLCTSSKYYNWIMFCNYPACLLQVIQIPMSNYVHFRNSPTSSHENGPKFLRELKFNETIHLHCIVSLCQINRGQFNAYNLLCFHLLVSNSRTSNYAVWNSFFLLANIFVMKTCWQREGG